jgi:Tfp pilus assembly protein PilN
MRPLNLIPPEERRGDSAPLRVGALSYVIVGVLAVALIAVTAMVLTSNKINDHKSELSSLQARQAAASQAAAGLAPYDEFAQLSTSRTATVTSLAKSRFDWERVLNELALVIPEDVTLQSLSATSTAGGDSTGSTTTDSSAATGPSLEITGCAEGQEGTARFLAALRDIDGVTRVGMSSSALAEADSSATGPTSEATGGCEGRPKAANFAITVAFDAVPTEAAAAAPAAPTTPATTPATTTSSGTTPTSNDGGVGQTQAEQQGATDSAATQTRKATDQANAVGVGK